MRRAAAGGSAAAGKMGKGKKVDLNEFLGGVKREDDLLPRGPSGLPRENSCA